jgi:hypothetical protein
MPSSHHHHAALRPSTRRTGGFTLFEVAISLVIAAFGVVSVLILFPVGIRAEQLARMRIYAGVKAEEIVEEFANASNTSPSIDTEAPDSWDVPSGYRVMTPDLESRVSTPRFGIMPVPSVIANRLDSDNDEIQSILSQGGNLYYSQAQETSGLEDSTEANSSTFPTDNQTQRLVFAVTGYAQNNNLAYLAWKDWPYYEPFPSPPGHGEKEGYGFSYGSNAVQGDHLPSDVLALNYTYTFPVNSYKAFITPWEGVGTNGLDAGSMDGHGGTIDGDIGTVYGVGFKPYALPGLANNSQPGATLYLQSALWYCSRKNLPDWVYNPAAGWNIDNQILRVMNAFKDDATVHENLKWSWVQSLRFLSHAATCLTRHYSLAQLGGQPSTGAGPAIPAATISAGTPDSPALPKLTHDLIVYYHELAMRMAMLYCSSQPYDWGVPRPTQRAIMTDFPLIEYDLLSPPLSGTISGTTIVASQWRPLPAHPIANIGRSYSYPDTPIIPCPPNANRFFSTASRNFTLAMPFSAAQRCRQLVFWSVDWQSYEDVETAPSAPIDASKYLFAAPMNDSNGNPISFDARMGLCQWPDHHIFAFRNPEKIITFTNAAVPTWPTGADVSGSRILSNNGENFDKYQGDSKALSMFLGLWGADRNFNGKLDRGPIPTSVRLRATLVSRYNYYDPRLTLKIK